MDFVVDGILVVLARTNPLIMNQILSALALLPCKPLRHREGEPGLSQ